MQGIGDIGIVPAQTVSEDQILYWQYYLRQGYQAGMGYLERNIDKRADPKTLLPGANSLIVAIIPYHPPAGTATNPHIALYAQGKDYHKVVKDKLFLLASLLPPSPFRAFCDTAPLLEKYWAWRAGLGYIGRNTLLIHPRFGSFCFIGIMLTRHRFDQYDQALPNSGGETAKTSAPPASIDTSIGERGNGKEETGAKKAILSSHPCTDCNRCLQSCPGLALGTGLDARRCFSYLTIEHKGERPAIQSPYWFGCDICQTVCPANSRWIPFSENIPEDSIDPRLLPLPATTSLTPSGIADMPQTRFDALFKESALQRAGLEGLKKNVQAWEKAHRKSIL